MHVDTDLGCIGRAHAAFLRDFFKRNGVRYHFSKIKISDKKRGKPSCFWCSWNRRKALFLAADKFKCNKVAMGHHKDDIIETLLLNIFFQGEFAAMNPAQELLGGKLTIIRPLCYVEEQHTRRFAKESGFPSQVCRCPNSETSKRRAMKDIIKKLERGCPQIKTNIFRSISRVNTEYTRIKSNNERG